MAIEHYLFWWRFIAGKTSIVNRGFSSQPKFENGGVLGNHRTHPGKPDLMTKDICTKVPSPMIIVIGIIIPARSKRFHRFEKLQVETTSPDSPRRDSAPLGRAEWWHPLPPLPGSEGRAEGGHDEILHLIFPQKKGGKDGKRMWNFARGCFTSFFNVKHPSIPGG